MFFRFWVLEPGFRGQVDLLTPGALQILQIPPPMCLFLYIYYHFEIEIA